MKKSPTISTPAAIVMGAVFLAIAAGCTSSNTRESEMAAADSRVNHSENRQMERVTNPIEAPPTGASTRVGGDLHAVVTGTDGNYRAGASRIDTPLPVGYPAPTPPGAIDLKTYPSVRMAEVAGSGNPDSGMNRAFWPLFNHIKKHDIAMTSPVEMSYSGLGHGESPRPTSWSMAFLYRTPELNATGNDGAVVVRDADSITVLAVGIKGDYSMSLVDRGRRHLEGWLAENPGWRAAGDWRSLYYNGPSLLYWNKWAEVQVPVRRAE